MQVLTFFGGGGGRMCMGVCLFAFKQRVYL